MKCSGAAPCQCHSSAGVEITSPARISSMAPPRDCTSPLPSVTYRVCPTAWECQAVRAEGVNRTALTRTREGSSPRAMASIQTSPVNHSAGPLAVGCLGWMGTGSSSLMARAQGTRRSRAQVSESDETAGAWSGVEGQLASRRSASSDGEPGSAV
jgi:hypothetical protein